MSFKSLLYCPDEKNACLVTQVLSDLDFTVELAAEPFAAVKRLTDEHFDALVVDCQNEQNASLLFKAARNSSDNHSSLSVAVVEGQAGVAKAFRIGANLVLTKPINVEQSKGTLRVARGLLRKNQQRPAAEAQPTVPAASAGQRSEYANQNERSSTLSFGAPISGFPARQDKFPGLARTATASAQAAPEMQMRTPEVPFSGIEVEQEPIPAPEAADAALLESMPGPTGKHRPELRAPLVHPSPVAASTAGQAAAVAPATEKKPAELSATGTAPMFTNEPIVSEAKTADSFVDEPLPAPTFSSLGRTSGEGWGGRKRFLKVAMLLVILGGGAYFAGPKLRHSPSLQQYLQLWLHRSPAHQESENPTSDQAASNAPDNAQQPPAGTDQSSAAQPATSSDQIHTTEFTAATSDNSKNDGSQSTQGDTPIETIEVTQAPAAQETNKITVTPKPLNVKPGEATPKPAQPVPPPMDVASTNSSEASLAGLITPEVALPKPAPGTIRISQGVSQGLLLKKVEPQYPNLAKQLHKEGTVQLLATVNKSGQISKVQVLGGDPILAKAAVDAVRQWEYRPYLLNGQPVEIETQISIIFKAPL
jgi:TonB family protein